MTQASPHSAQTSAPRIAPPPWDLVGTGAVLWLRPARGLRRTGALDLGSALAFVDYERSGVDPYLELLHVPYLTHSRGAFGPTIDRIWVTSERSVVSGRANWGIPKDLARITRDVDTDGAVRWTAAARGEALASLTLSPAGPRLPVAKPRAVGRLLQRMHGTRYATPISTTGWVQPARVRELSLGRAFDDVDPARVALALIVPRFRMGFHAAEIG